MKPRPEVLTRKPQVRCTVYLDLISRVCRPFQFRATVVGADPRLPIKVYDLTGWNEQEVAQQAMDIYSEQMTRPVHLIVVPH